jgi:hypothetical protein
MAYDAEAAFATSTEGFDAEKMVAEKLSLPKTPSAGVAAVRESEHDPR